MRLRSPRAVTEPRSPKGRARHSKTAQPSVQQGFVPAPLDRGPCPPSASILHHSVVFSRLLYLQGSGFFGFPSPPEAGGFPSLCPLKVASNHPGFPPGAVWPLSRAFTPAEKPCARGSCPSKLRRRGEGSGRGSSAPSRCRGEPQAVQHRGAGNPKESELIRGARGGGNG